MTVILHNIHLHGHTNDNNILGFHQSESNQTLIHLGLLINGLQHVIGPVDATFNTWSFGVHFAIDLMTQLKLLDCKR